MPLQLATRHDSAFDIFTPFIDPALSSYARSHGPAYVKKVLDLYAELGIQSALWTVPASQPLRFLEPEKPIEYRLVVADHRPIAWIDEGEWSAYIHGNILSFSRYSLKPILYEHI